ncbi:MAG: hypothetical protein D6705_12935 [Deltaproteobacteria bacterium]|nr:MAG: hypothetical protein D6705_12935 [Deltaproteobacteria bacterium]
MPASPSLRFIASTAIALLLPLAGCDAFEAIEAFEEDSNLLEVLSAHHGTPVDGAFPELGIEDGPRIFENDLGWTVNLTAGYAVVTHVAVTSCKGVDTDLDAIWGHFAEDFTDLDLDTTVVASKRVAAGLYCELRMTYGPYDPDVVGASGSAHTPPDDPEVVGASVYLKGFANKGDQQVSFELRSTGTAVAAIDISTLEDGEPVRVVKENFSEQITISKAYDRIFDGVDFATFDPAALEAEMPDRVAAVSRPSAGNRVEIY